MTSALSAWQQRGTRARHREHAIFVQAGGGGPALPILCVHGFPTASWDWHRLWDRLVSRAQLVVAPDLIGFGFSDKPANYAYSIADQAELCESLLRDRGVTRYRLLAHDYGDTVAQELLARHEARRAANDGSLVLEAVCFLNGGLFPEVHRPRLVQKLLLSPLGPVLSRVISEKSFSRSFSAIFGDATKPSTDELADMWRLITHAGGNRISHRLLHYIPERRAFRDRWVGAMMRTQVPMRLVCGMVDPVSGAHMAARYREVVPNADVRELPSIGHYPQLEAPDAVWAACEDIVAA
jgi:pimeloyl-ACP methyl ester carboxylesterase